MDAGNHANVEDAEAAAQLAAARLRVAELEAMLQSQAEQSTKTESPKTTPATAPAAVPLRPPPIPASLPEPEEEGIDLGELQQPAEEEAFKTYVDDAASSDSSLSTIDTSIGCKHNRTTTAGVEGAEYYLSSDSEQEPGIRAQGNGGCLRGRASASRSVSRFSRSVTSAGKPWELETVVPESEFLDMHRMDVTKVVDVHRHYDGCNVPHYLAGSFEEGFSAETLPDMDPAETESLIPFCKIISIHTNRSKRKTSAEIIKYCIYVCEGLSGLILDASTEVFEENGKAVGRVACLFGAVSEPSYLVQDVETAIEEEGAEVTDCTSRLLVGAALYTKKTNTVLYERPEKGPEASVFDSLKRLHTKGCDASFLGDEELPVERQEFSDDEKEREARAKRKQLRKANPQDANRIGLIDMIDEDDDSSSASEFEFNDDGEIVAQIRKSTIKTAPTRKRKQSELPQVAGPDTRRPTFIPPPPARLRGDPKIVHVSNIPNDLAWHQLAAIMGASFGPVEEAVVAVCKGCGEGVLI